ncbi:MAG: serine/threonine protein kinase [Cyanobacteria bacterium P01_A01_bin.114]
MESGKLTAQPLSLSEFWQSPFRELLAYPHGDLESLDKRYQELKAQAVDAIYNFGPQSLKGFHLLGAGYCGLVFLAQWRGALIALKVRRLTAPRSSFDHEAAMLAIANQAGIGPHYLGHSQNFLRMGYLSGPSLFSWVQTRLAIKTWHHTLRLLLEQAYQLDQIGLDHGNLGCATEHVIISPQGPAIIDFSSASTQRRPANVTSLIQGLFIGSQIALALRAQALSPSITKAALIEQLRSYKHHPGHAQFDRLLHTLSNSE